MTSKTSSYRDALLKSLSDPHEAAHYLNAAISDSPEMFLKALRNVAQSRQMAKVAREAGVTRESLYRATSEIGNPTLDTLESVLTAMGIKIKFEADASVAGAPSSPSPTDSSTSPQDGND
jgi:probable addiction module antidote protein